MQTVVRKLILLVVIALAGCAPMTPKEPVTPTVPEETAHPIFLDAENAFDNGDYALALERYQAILNEATDDALKDRALFKIGKIYRLTDRDDEALAIFYRLAKALPKSAMAPEAMAEALRLLFDRGEYESVIRDGREYIQTADKSERLVPIYTIIADTYKVMGAKVDEAHFRYCAMIDAADENEAKRTWEDLRKSAEQLSAEEIESLVNQVTDQRAMGYLLYRLGLTLIMEEKYDDAMNILGAYVDQFPSHEDRQDALNMIQSLKEHSRFTPFTVGCVLPLSGAYGLFGRRALDGIEFALSRIGEIGGGIPFQIMVKDSRSDAQTSIDAVEALDQQKVGAILGPMAVSEAAAEVAQKRGVPIIVFTQKEGVVDVGPYVFRNFITPQMQVQALVSFAIDQLGANRFAILYPDENYGKRFMNLFWDQVVSHGREVTGVESYDPHNTDFAVPIKKVAGLFYPIPKDLKVRSLPAPRAQSLFDQDDDGFVADRPVLKIDLEDALIGIPLGHATLERITQRNPDREDHWYPIVDFDAVFIPDAPKKAGLVIPQLAYYDIRDVYILGTNLWNSQALLDMSADYMKSTFVVDGFFAQSEDNDVKAFVDAFTQIYNRRPGIIEAVAYDSTLMVFNTMRQNATDSRREIKKALAQLHDFKGVSGNTSFSPNGEAQKSMTMLRIEKGHFVEIDPPKPAPVPVDEPHE